MENRGIWLLAMAVVLAGCGKKPGPPPAPETPQYDAWRLTHIPIPAAGFAPTVNGRIVVQPPEARSKNPEDFFEIFVNGDKLHRFRVGKMPDGKWPVCEVAIVLRTGPDWIDVWDSSSNSNLRQQVDTRYGTDFLFVPTTDGYDLQQIKRE